MIVTQEQYENMKKTIMVNISEGRKIKASECNNMGIDIEAVISLHSQTLVRLRKIDFKKADVNITKTVLAKVKCFQKDNNHNDQNGNGFSDKNSHPNDDRVSNHGKKKGLSLLSLSNELGISSYRTAKIVIENLLGKNVSVSQVIEDPQLLSDEWVRRNVLECVMNDPLCSLESDQLKECTGKEFEALLLQQLQVSKVT